MGNKPGSQGGGGGAGGGSDRKAGPTAASALPRSGSSSGMGDSGSVNSLGDDEGTPVQVASDSSEEQTREAAAAAPLSIDSVT
jgi:hypothetical protein